MRQNNRKKSQFPASQSVLNDAYFDFVSNGTNYRIPYVDFLAALGVTGTLEQAGLGTPILDKQAQDNFIRNIEDGPGIKASVSLDNGLILEHDFIQDVAGAPVLINPTSDQPTIASIIPGSGIQVSSDGGRIVIGATDTEQSIKTIVIREKTDLPAPVLNVITLQDDREYFFANDIDLVQDTLLMGANCIIRGSDSIIITLSYDGTDFMINMNESTQRVSSLSLSAPNGGLIKKTDTAKGSLGMDGIFFLACAKLAEFTAVDSLIRLTQCSTRDSTQVLNGMEFSGTFNTFIQEMSGIEVGAGILYNLGSAVFGSFMIDHVLSDMPAGTTYLSGLTLSGNIAPEGMGILDTPIITGAGGSLVGVTLTDDRWIVSNSNSISNTRSSGLLSLQDNAIDTVITTAGVPVLVEGVWDIVFGSQMKGTTAGDIKYTATRDLHVGVTASVAVESSGGGEKLIAAYIAINSVVSAGSKQVTTTSAGTKQQITLSWQLLLNIDDYVEIYIANEDDITNILVSTAILNII